MADKYSHSELKEIALTDNELSIKEKCQLLNIPRSSIYYKPVPPSDEELQIKRCIDKIYTARPIYGYRKMTVALTDNYHFKVGYERVRKYMNEMGIEAIYPRHHTSKPNPANKVYPYLLKGVEINRPDMVWGIDITYIPIKNSWMYLVAIIDWYSRYVVGYSLQDSLEIAFVLSTCREALMRAKPEIMNSDQGSHFTSPKYTEIFLSKDVKISMDHRGRAYDNIFTERLWRSVKYEDIYLNDYDSPRALRNGLNEYFDFYNNERPHQSLDYLTPARVYKSTADKPIASIMIKH